MTLSEDQIADAFEAEWPLAIADAGVEETKLARFLTSGTTPANAEGIPAWLWPPQDEITQEESALAGATPGRASRGPSERPAVRQESAPGPAL